MELRNGFISHLKNHYPTLTESLDQRPELVSENLLSPFVIRLPKMILNQIEESVRAVHELRHYISSQQRPESHRDVVNPGNYSSMMSLDFHLNDQQNLKLIEINTNAAFLILNWEMYRFRGLEYPVKSFSPRQWQADLEEEMKLNRDRFHKKQASENPFVVISDEDPEQQRLFVEFLVAQEWIRSWGWKSEIRDFKNVIDQPKPDLVYNRCTDFYFEQPLSLEAKKSYLNGDVCFTPNPFEYSLLADKERMIEWSRPGYLESLAAPESVIQGIRKILPLCIDLSADRAEEIWSQRKHLFFKPKREFGSKKAFRGASISRKMFDEMVGEDMLAQEYVPPQELTFETPEGPLKLKYDLRCHFYQDRLESVFARLYQGQVTNLKTPYGGFTPVVFE